MATRQIEPGMVGYLDLLLVNNGLAKKAIADKDARLLLQIVAGVCVGIREEGGNNQGPLVRLIQETVGSANGEAWCLSYVETMVAYCELKTGIQSPLYVTEHCLTAWAKTPVEQRVKRIPAPGAIVIWQHGNSQSGHTGVLLRYASDGMYCVEGNTTAGLRADGSIERDGGGVHYTKRDKRQNGDMKVVGFLKPF